jgi:CRP-like cAMP-binding protein
MVNPALAAPLMRLELFRGLAPRQIEAIARAAEKVIARDGDVICEAGIAADAAILVVSGPAFRVHAAGRPPQLVEPGSLIGEMAMLTEHTFGITVIARGQVRLLRLERQAMRAVMLADRSIAEILAAGLSDRLSAVAGALRRIDQQLEAGMEAFDTAICEPPAGWLAAAGRQPAVLSTATH